MQKAYSLQPEEIRQAKQLEEEQRNLLAQLGSMSLQKKQITKRLPQIEEEQRRMIRGVVERCGVSQYNFARVDGSNLVVEVPDQPPPPMENSKPESAAHTNGAA